jgi:hypothetical protein
MRHFGVDKMVFNSKFDEVNLIIKLEDKETVGSYWNLIPSHK